jgi:hypothetical protein
MKWDAGPNDVNRHSPDGVKTWIDRDIRDFKQLCDGDADGRLGNSHARAAMVQTNRMKP